ncbi:hypothetical protein C8J56DRAFT_884079 [Mycena floridula]|nr:hypothetical protein C8J56DRAFT_884079 [Mycena floridula]
MSSRGQSKKNLPVSSRSASSAPAVEPNPDSAPAAAPAGNIMSITGPAVAAVPLVAPAAKRKPGNQGDFHGPQLALLESFLEDYLDMPGKKEISGSAFLKREKLQTWFSTQKTKWNKANKTSFAAWLAQLSSRNTTPRYREKAKVYMQMPAYSARVYSTFLERFGEPKGKEETDVALPRRVSIAKELLEQEPEEEQTKVVDEHERLYNEDKVQHEKFLKTMGMLEAKEGDKPLPPVDPKLHEEAHAGRTPEKNGCNFFEYDPSSYRNKLMPLFLKFLWTIAGEAADKDSGMGTEKESGTAGKTVTGASAANAEVSGAEASVAGKPSRRKSGRKLNKDEKGTTRDVREDESPSESEMNDGQDDDNQPDWGRNSPEPTNPSATMTPSGEPAIPMTDRATTPVLWEGVVLNRKMLRDLEVGLGVTPKMLGRGTKRGRLVDGIPDSSASNAPMTSVAKTVVAPHRSSRKAAVEEPEVSDNEIAVAPAVSLTGDLTKGLEKGMKKGLETLKQVEDKVWSALLGKWLALEQSYFMKGVKSSQKMMTAG